MLELPGSRLSKAIELCLLDVTCYDLELVAWCCSHVEVLLAAGVPVRSPAGIFWTMLEAGGDGHKSHAFHELATPNLEEHRENLERLRSPALERRRPKAFDDDPARKAEAVPHVAEPAPLSRETRPADAWTEQKRRLGYE